MTASGQPTWYDLLDVDRTASTDEIRAAWKAAVADLDPTDRRFQRLSQAAAVLLDEERRAEYDASLAEESLESEDGVGLDTPSPSGSGYSTSDAGYSTSDAGYSTRDAGYSTRDGGDDSAGRGASASERIETPAADRGPRAWAREVSGVVLAAVAVVALVLVAAAAFAWSRPDPQAIEAAADDARSAAERAVVPVLSYDYRTLADGQRQAESYLTPTYRDKKFRPIFATIEKNAPTTQTVVKTSVVESSIVRAGEDRVEVLLLVDRPTTNKAQQTPVRYEDHVTLTMEKSGGRWLVDDMTT